MSSWKTPAIVAVVVAAVVGGAFATGAVKLRSTAPSTDPSAPDDSSKAEIEKLESLGYSGAVEIRPEHQHKSGVTRAKEGAFDSNGLGIVTPLGWGAAFIKAGGKKAMTEARLVDMRGEIVHRWTHRPKRRDRRHGWDIAKLGSDGLLYAIHDRNALLVLDWDSNVVREVRGRFHHDLALDEGGVVVVMDEQRRTLVDPVDNYEYDLLDHGFTFIDQEGEVVRTLWLHDALTGQDFYEKHLTARLNQWRPARTKRGEPNQLADFFHANTVEVLHADVEGRWNKGDLMTTIRQMDFLVVLSREDGRLRWWWGQGTLDRPHDPSQTAGDHILLFDNGWHRKKSRVIEFSATTGEIIWSYEGSGEDPLFSKKRGLAQLLGGGSVVINSSQNARTIEVRRDGEIVWEYFGPDMVGEFRVPIRYIRLEAGALEFARGRLASGADG